MLFKRQGVHRHLDDGFVFLNGGRRRFGDRGGRLFKDGRNFLSGRERLFLFRGSFRPGGWLRRSRKRFRGGSRRNFLLLRGFFSGRLSGLPFGYLEHHFLRRKNRARGCGAKPGSFAAFHMIVVQDEGLHFAAARLVGSRLVHAFLAGLNHQIRAAAG
ncbi:MAG: hypothetical protein GMKNLPBB_03153 [Myxococcota bacterium]|nr:hypothetical protein [Myxococcota bacterium]